MPSMLDDKVWTIDDLPAEDDGYVYEIVRGDLLRVSLPGYWHGRITMRLGSAMEVHAQKHELGATLAAETGFVLERNPDTFRAPDVAFLERGRLPPGKLHSSFEGAPDLAVEVASPSQTFAFLHAKCLQWQASGARLVWLVEPEAERVDVYRPARKIEVLTRDDTLDGHDVLPGFALPLAELFAAP